MRLLGAFKQTQHNGTEGEVVLLSRGAIAPRRFGRLGSIVAQHRRQVDRPGADTARPLRAAVLSGAGRGGTDRTPTWS